MKARLSRLWPYVRRYVFDVLVVVGAGGAFFELLAARDDPTGPFGASPWVIGFVAVGMPLPLLARRQGPFVAPLTVLVVAGSPSFVHRHLVTWSFFLLLATLS